MSKLKVEYVDHMGDDLRVVNSARISMGAESQKLEPKDIKLINYLAKHKHYTPFEHNTLTVIIDCPLYIRSQIHRHRTFSYNEISRRYTDKDLEFFGPTTFRKQHKSSKQCSDGNLSAENDLKAQVLMQDIHNKALQTFENMIKLGVSREQARGVLPQNLMTSFYMTGNLRNWIAFLKLRDDSHAQLEVQILSQEIKKIILEKFPESAKALINNL